MIDDGGPVPRGVLNDEPIAREYTGGWIFLCNPPGHSLADLSCLPGICAANDPLLVRPSGRDSWRTYFAATTNLFSCCCSAKRKVRHRYLTVTRRTGQTTTAISSPGVRDSAEELLLNPREPFNSKLLIAVQ